MEEKVTEEFRQLRKLNELLFNAFMLSSQIWLFESRKEMIELFNSIVSECEGCTAVVVCDGTGNYYRMKENVLNCRFLNYIPKVFSVVDSKFCSCINTMHRYLVVIPGGEIAAYIFLEEMEEEQVQILKEMVEVLSKAVEHLEIRNKNEKIIEQLKENLKHFQFLADRLRNPLSVIMGVAELANEIELETLFEMIRRSAERMKEVLDSLSEMEVSSIKLYESVFSRR